MLDAVQLGVAVRVGGLLPRPGALERDTPLVQELPQPLPPDLHPPGGTVSQVGGELAHAPVRKGLAQLSGRVVAAVTMTSMSSSLIRRGRPPAHRGSSAARPLALNRWITSRTVSSSAATSRAIALTGVPDADAMMIIAPADPDRLVPARRTICCRRCPS